MELNCPECNAPLTVSGNTPKFCSNCGGSLTSFIESKTSGGDAASDATTPPKALTKRLHGASDETITRDSAGNWIAQDSAATDSQVGPYALIRKLGQGGMGTVYEAVNEETGQRVALKLLSRSLRTTEESVQRFRRESQIAASINHPRSTFVYEGGQHEGQFFITMELMSGGTLKEVVEQGGPLEVGQAVDFVLDMIDGLQVAHEAGIVHRDLKPSNSFVDNDGRVKIGDFGLAKSFVADSSLTQTGAFMGTPQFAAPEQLRAAVVDERSDIYAIGGTLFYLLSGSPPFTGGAAQVIASIASEVPARVNTLNKSVPRELARVVAQTLEKDPAKRPENLNMLRSALLPYSTRGASLADVGRRLAAFFIDLFVAGMMAGLFSQFATLVLISAGDVTTLMSFKTITLLTICAQSFGAIFYFAVLEWRWGRTLGKWMLGMRVIGSNGEPPGVFPAILRAVLIPGLTFFLGSLPGVFSDFTQTTSIELRDLIAFITTSQVTSILSWIPAFLCLSTARASNGFRGIHDLLTGTRVVRLAGALESKRLERIPITAPVKIRDFGQFGAYKTVARYNKPDQPLSVYLGRDAELERNVWVFHRDGALGEFEGDRKSVTRPNRLRLIMEGTDNDGWQVTEAVQGCPLLDIILKRKSCSWESIRHGFLELANELDYAIADQTLPKALSIDQIWIAQSGHIKLLDRSFELSESQQSSALRVHSNSDPMKRACDLFKDLLAVYSARHPVPMHVIEFRRELEQRTSEGTTEQSDHLAWAARQLAEFADRPSNWKWDDRLGLLAVAFGSELPIYIASVFLVGFLVTRFSEPSPLWFGTGVAAAVAALAFGLGFIFNGGPAIRLSGIQVCRPKSQVPASKIRGGMRNLIVWLPFISLFVMLLVLMQVSIMNIEPGDSVVVQNNNVSISRSGPAEVGLLVTLLLCSLPVILLILIGVIWTLIRPSRGLPDLVVGTELIRK